MAGRQRGGCHHQARCEPPHRDGQRSLSRPAYPPAHAGLAAAPACLGFTHFAAEALDKRDTELAHRGYALATSGSEYLREPLYGDIVREAIRLGFVIVPYESSDMTPKIRENSQADNLYRRVFMADPAARLFVHAGYAHIDKAPGGLGEDVRPMAMELKRLSGFDPLSINQTVFSGVDPPRDSRRLTSN